MLCRLTEPKLPRRTEINQYDLVVTCQHNVVRFDVPVNQTVAVQFGQGVTEHKGNPVHLIQRQSPLRFNAVL